MPNQRVRKNARARCRQFVINAHEAGPESLTRAATENCAIPANSYGNFQSERFCTVHRRAVFKTCTVSPFVDQKGP